MLEINDKSSFDLQSLVRRGSTASTTREYNADLRRLLPWPGFASTKRAITEFGTIIVTVRAGEEVDRHRHDEEECFIVISGSAELEVEEQITILDSGDVAYIPRFWHHQIKNKGDNPFVFIDIYWDDKGRTFEEYVEENKNPR